MARTNEVDDLRRTWRQRYQRSCLLSDTRIASICDRHRGTGESAAVEDERIIADMQREDCATMSIAMFPRKNEQYRVSVVKRDEAGEYLVGFTLRSFDSTQERDAFAEGLSGVTGWPIHVVQ